MRNSTIVIVQLGILLASMMSPRPLFASIRNMEISLQDISNTGSPVILSGYVVFSDDDSKVTRYRYELSASATNLSNKPILLMVIRFHASTGGIAPGYSQTYNDDLFFSDKSLAPDTSALVGFSSSRFGSPLVNGQRIAPAESNIGPSSATGHVDFVQFADGTFWGNVESAAGPLHDRQSSLKELFLLEQIYGNGGDSALAEQLIAPNSSSLVSQLKYVCESKQAGSNCVQENVRRLIDFAKMNEAALEIKPHNPTHRPH